MSLIWHVKDLTRIKATTIAFEFRGGGSFFFYLSVRKEGDSTPHVEPHCYVAHLSLREEGVSTPHAEPHCYVAHLSLREEGVSTPHAEPHCYAAQL